MRTRERLQAAISCIPRCAPGGAARFQDNISYHPCRLGEGPLIFTLQRPLPIAGLSGLSEICLPLPQEQREKCQEAMYAANPHGVSGD